MKLNISFLLAMLFIASNTYAENGCPPGQLPAQANGAITSCTPIPSGYYQQEAPQPRPSGQWIKTWGAIAMGSIDSTNSYGVTTDKLSKLEAESDALKRCASHGETNCQIGLVYQNQCAAIAEPSIDGKTFVGGLSDFVGAGSKDKASEIALERCKKNNRDAPGAVCKVIYTACTEPVFERY